MLQERLLRHTLDFTAADRVRVLHRLSLPPTRRDSGRAVLRSHPHPAERTKIASGNAEALFRLA
jgi:hypothetical protein